MAVGGQRPSVESPLHKLRQHAAAQRCEDDGPALEEILLPSADDDCAVAQHHHSFAVLQLIPHEALEDEGITADDLQGGQVQLLGDFHSMLVPLHIFALQRGFRLADLLVGQRLGRRSSTHIMRFVVEPFEHAINIIRIGQGRKMCMISLI
jgi:hypothetical protein